MDLYVAEMGSCGEGKLGNGWRRVMGEIVLLFGRVLDLYRTRIYAILSEN